MTTKSESKLMEKNPNWKGDDVGYGSLHEWVKNRLPKPVSCQICYSVPPQDLANRSGRYLRDLNDWFWLCRRCHMLMDGRLKNLQNCPKPKTLEKRIPENRKCYNCGSTRTYINKGDPQWYSYKDSFICDSCHTRLKRGSKKFYEVQQK